MTEKLPHCKACTTGLGRHQFNTQEHGGMPDRWKDKTEEQLHWLIKGIMLAKRNEGEYVKVSPYQTSEEIKMKKYIKTYDDKKEKEVLCGYVEGDTYYRDVDNKHFMVKHDGYGIQLDVMNQLLKMGVKTIVINTKAGTTHTVPFRTWATKGKKDSYGHGEQIFLSKKFMNVT